MERGKQGYAGSRRGHGHAGIRKGHGHAGIRRGQAEQSDDSGEASPLVIIRSHHHLDVLALQDTTVCRATVHGSSARHPLLQPVKQPRQPSSTTHGQDARKHKCSTHCVFLAKKASAARILPPTHVNRADVICSGQQSSVPQQFCTCSVGSVGFSWDVTCVGL